MWVTFVLCVWSVVLASSAENVAESKETREDKIVRTPQGPVRGYKDPATNIFVFHGIPYATAPTGQYKFMDPLPPPARLETFDAVDNKIICPQNNMFLTPGTIIDENCLIANIYLPDTKQKKLPVVVYIHGGAFQLGFGNLLTPKELIKDRDIIAVTFNYRLGIHGFLCLGTERAPGNAGMKDQLALLRWVKKNIATFGGNPDDVTIAGYSAGSVSVDLLTLSPAAKGLFNKAIPESGSGVGVVSIQIDPLEQAKAYAKSMNFNNVDDIYALEEFYTSASYDQLTSPTYLNIPNSTFGFVPCVEHVKGSNAFLTDTPLNILKMGNFNKVPLLYGFANMEGLFRMNFFEQWKDLMNEKFSDFLPADLQFKNEAEKEQIARSVKEFYFGVDNVNDDTMLKYIDYFTDVLFAYPTLKTVAYQASAGNNNVYLYEYSFVESGGIPAGYKNYTVDGASHCAQTFTVLDGLDLNKDVTSQDFKKFQAIIREMWYNFITKGQPVPEGSSLPAWPPMGADWSPHMALSNKVQLRGSLLLERARFWDEIYELHYRQPVPPPVPPTRHSEL